MKETNEKQMKDVEEETLAIGQLGPENGRLVFGPDVDDFGFDLFHILLAVGRRKRLIFVVVAAAALMTAAISLMIPNRYTAVAKILPPQQTQSTVSMVLNQLANTTGGTLVSSLASKDLGLKNPNDIYLAILRSRTVADRLIAKFDLASAYDDPDELRVRNRLEHSSDIVTSKDGLISISVQDSDPKRAAAIANGYVDELKLLTQDLAVTEASQRRLFFEQQLQRSKEEMAKAEVDFKDTQQRTGMIQLDSQAKALIDSAGYIRGQISMKEVQLESIQSFATENNPEYLKVQEELAALRNQLNKVERQQPGNQGDIFLPTSKIPGAELEYIRRLREMKYREAVYELLTKQYEAAKIDEAKQAVLIQILDPAFAPERKSSPQRLLMVLFITTAVALSMVLYAISAEFYETAKRDPVRGTQLATLKQIYFGSRKSDWKSPRQ